MTGFLNYFVLNLQIYLFHSKNDKQYCHYTNKFQNFNSYTNLTLKTAKQEMCYLKYHNALWDCFEFQIAQIGNMLPNQAMLPDLAIGLDW